MSFEPEVESRPVDVQESGRPGPVATGLFKGIEELLLFSVEEGPLERISRRRLRRALRHGPFPHPHDAFGKVLGLDGRSRTE